MQHTVLIVGSGGREQAIAHHLAISPQVKKVLVAPGNPGSDTLSSLFHLPIQNIPLSQEDPKLVIKLAKENKASLVVIGSETWLEKGMGDKLKQAGIPAIAPLKNRAILELDKAYTRKKCLKWGVPQPRFAIFTSPQNAIEYVRQHNLKDGVIKVSGPALGKGVTVCDNRQEMETAILNAKTKFGSAADKLLVEEKLVGKEVSYVVLTDGKNFISLPPAMDYKRIFDRDRGGNTGGMGAICPNPFVTKKIVQEIEQKIIIPIIQGMRALKRQYQGVLYAGIMLTKTGPYLIEINARHGDPETQVQLPLLSVDLFTLYQHVTKGTLSQLKQNRASKKATITVVMSATGYPDSAQKGATIYGLNTRLPKGVVVYQAGTKQIEDKIIVNGGRVLNITATAPTLTKARNLVYKVIKSRTIKFTGMHYRKDIGK